MSISPADRIRKRTTATSQPHPAQRRQGAEFPALKTAKGRRVRRLPAWVMNTPKTPPKAESAPPIAGTSTEALMDAALAETFPASDPVSSTAGERREAEVASRRRRKSRKLEVVDASPAPPPAGPLFPTSDDPPSEIPVR
jgi:hypothetical protein